MQLPFFSALRDARSILIAGCGGGFDVYSGLPLYMHLTGQGKTVRLANLSFTRLEESGPAAMGGKAWIVDAKARNLAYFPELYLAEWFAAQGRAVSVVAFPRTGVAPLHEAYREVVERFAIDAIILVDGGTDSVVKGDEPGLGTPEEDAASLAAVADLDVPVKLLACLGFGVDHFHGVSHHSFLENTAELARLGGFLGCCSLTQDDPGARAFVDATAHANARMSSRQSIVCNSIASALRGEFGDAHATGRTRSSELFINPLMTLYWFYDVARLARWNGFYEDIRHTRTYYEVSEAIRSHRERRRIRPRKPIPL